MDIISQYSRGWIKEAKRFRYSYLNREGFKYYTLKSHRNGLVIKTKEEYDAAVDKVLNAEPSIIEIEYIPNSHLITDYFNL